MNLLFLQNCVSPHQMPFIAHLPGMLGVGRVVVVTPRVDYDYRRDMGWEAAPEGRYPGVEFLISPTLGLVRELYDECEGQRTVCFFSGITAFAELVPCMRLSFSYEFERAVITEPPFVYGRPLWMHKLRFALKDWRYVRRFGRVFVMGEDYVGYYKRWCGGWQVHPFMYCTEWRERTLPPTDSATLRIVFVGSLEDRKNLAWAVDALKGEKDIEITVVGDGPERQSVMRSAADGGVKLTIVGRLPMDGVAEVMQRHDLLLLPSKHDGWGAVVNEALTLGLYVVCSDRCGAKMLLKEDFLGRVFKLGDADGFRALISEAAARKSALRGDTQRRIDWARENISGEKVAEYLYERVRK